MPGPDYGWSKRPEQVQQRIERDHQHRKGRLGPTRGFKTLRGALALCAGRAFLRHPRGGVYDLAQRTTAVRAWSASPVCRSWDAPTAELLVR